MARTRPVAGSMEAPPTRTLRSALFFLLVLDMTLSSTALTRESCFFFSSVVVMR